MAVFQAKLFHNHSVFAYKYNRKMNNDQFNLLTRSCWRNNRRFKFCIVFLKKHTKYIAMNKLSFAIVFAVVLVMCNHVAAHDAPIHKHGCNDKHTLVCDQYGRMYAGKCSLEELAKENHDGSTEYYTCPWLHQDACECPVKTHFNNNGK